MQMAKVGFTLKRVAAAFAEIESSSSEINTPCAESLTDLSELVNSFLENYQGSIEEENIEDCKNVEDSEVINNFIQTSKDLKSILAKYKDDDVKTSIVKAVEEMVLDEQIEIDSLPLDFNHRLFAWLRCKGFDAGLCKSKWGKTRKIQGGSYEYIDVMVDENRYIMDVNIAKEFEIARPTTWYVEELKKCPPIFVGKRDELKEIVKLMCKCMKESMKTMGMHLPPWRKFAYVRAKWLSSYKRKTKIEYGALDEKASDFLSRTPKAKVDEESI